MKIIELFVDFNFAIGPICQIGPELSRNSILQWPHYRSPSVHGNAPDDATCLVRVCHVQRQVPSPYRIVMPCLSIADARHSVSLAHSLSPSLALSLLLSTRGAPCLPWLPPEAPPLPRSLTCRHPPT
jgi:hypothetical protein